MKHRILIRTRLLRTLGTVLVGLMALYAISAAPSMPGSSRRIQTQQAATSIMHFSCPSHGSLANSHVHASITAYTHTLANGRTYVDTLYVSATRSYTHTSALLPDRHYTYLMTTWEDRQGGPGTFHQQNPTYFRSVSTPIKDVHVYVEWRLSRAGSFPRTVRCDRYLS